VRRPGTRHFGAATSGVPTALRGFTLADGSVLRLTTGLGVDRAGRTHGGPLPPDVEVAASRALAAARAWVAAQPPCRARWS
jgi:C-terminal processing protease CtpA/Prc